VEELRSKAKSILNKSMRPYLKNELKGVRDVAQVIKYLPSECETCQEKAKNRQRGMGL
jgi:hypothetical protein